MSFEDDFLAEFDSRTWRPPEGGPRELSPRTLFLGVGDHALEVAVASAAGRPTAESMRRLWHARQGRRPSPALLVVGYPEHGETRVSVCGPVGEQPPVLHVLDPSQVERLAAAALAEPNRHAAVRFLVAMLPEVGSDLPGLRNSGLLATQELKNGVPTRSDWKEACNRGREALQLRGRQLVERLGFGVEQLSITSSVLTVGTGAKRAVAVLLDEGEAFDQLAGRFGATPVSHALALADREGVPWVVLTRARQIRLYAVGPDTGVGRKGRAETFVEIDLALLPEHSAGYLELLFSARALIDRGTLEEILQQSADFAAELAVRLCQRVYYEAVPALAAAVSARLNRDGVLTEADLDEAYEQALIVLFRLLFVAYAEDKNLLPYRTNSRYSDHALKTIARRLTEDRTKSSVSFDPHAIDLWEDVRQLWRAVDKGNTGWGVPEYNGGLFSSDPQVNRAGAALSRIEVTDAEFGPVLMALLVDEGPDGLIGPVDFRSLSVREFGTIYEGLLESMLSVAPVDLAVDSKGHYTPAAKPDQIVVHKGDIYFHNRSGTRKATGSYFTKPFAVEHLLDSALVPALSDHIGRLQGLLDESDEVAAAEAFFDFRCVDLAMGSGHFLVAAVDRIEARLSAFFTLHPIGPVAAEMDQLRKAATDALGDLADGVEIETTSLLRRQVARRCIYGVDVNHISVELARLSIWIHTFVPGLPLSFLDHNLVCGNSLTGIGTIEEAVALIDPKAKGSGAQSLFGDQIDEFLSRAEDSLRRLARVTEATVADIAAARQAHDEALAAVQPARDLFDLLVAGRLSEIAIPVTADEARIASDAGLTSARRVAAGLDALHFPVAFPEVFLRDPPGFDCVVGNPPWEEPVVEELQFWTIRFPGLKALPNVQQQRELTRLASERPDLVTVLQGERAQAERVRRVLGAGQFPGMGTGDPDLYKAFLWRFVNLCRPGGRLGVVVPRSVFAAKGTAPWRLAVLPHSACSIVFTKNRNEWLFTDVNPGYTVALLALQRASDTAVLGVRGTFQSLGDFRARIGLPATHIDLAQLQRVDEHLCIPVLEDGTALALFGVLISHPPFGSSKRADFRARPHTELHATNDAAEFFTNDVAGLPVYNHLNVGHFRFDSSIGAFNYTDEEIVTSGLLKRRRASWGKKSSPFTEMPLDWVNHAATLPMLHPRIVLRDVVHSTNPRKVWAALAPSRAVLTNKGPYLLFPRGDLVTQAYVLGVLGSSVCDWFGHLRINLNLNFFILNSIPVPEYTGTEQQRRLAELAASLAVRDGTRREYEAWIELAVSMHPEEALAELDALASLIYGVPDELLEAVWNVRTRPSVDAVRTWREQWSN